MSRTCQLPLRNGRVECPLKQGSVDIDGVVEGLAGVLASAMSRLRI